LGLWHERVAHDAEAAGLQVVMDRCLKIEHARFHGGLHLAGFNTGVIDSRRPR
jgi:predicted CoA-binding protein